MSVADSVGVPAPKEDRYEQGDGLPGHAHTGNAEHDRESMRRQADLRAAVPAPKEELDEPR